jgi:hypothetical protein
MSWKLEVQTDTTGKWYSNALVFSTKQEAEWSAKVLANNWLIVRDWRVVESDKPVNAVCNEYGKHQIFPLEKLHEGQRRVLS